MLKDLAHLRHLQEPAVLTEPFLTLTAFTFKPFQDPKTELFSTSNTACRGTHGGQNDYQPWFFVSTSNSGPK